MALYKYAQYLANNSDTAFDAIYSPGIPAPYHGIYKCVSCGDEIAMPVGHVLPPQNHNQHNPSKGRIAWKLVVFAVQQR
jgi:hypothetical protein